MDKYLWRQQWASSWRVCIFFGRHVCTGEAQNMSGTSVLRVWWEKFKVLDPVEESTFLWWVSGERMECLECCTSICLLQPRVISWRCPWVDIFIGDESRKGMSCSSLNTTCETITKDERWWMEPYALAALLYSYQRSRRRAPLGCINGCLLTLKDQMPPFKGGHFWIHYRANQILQGPFWRPKRNNSHARTFNGWKTTNVILQTP